MSFDKPNIIPEAKDTIQENSKQEIKDFMEKIVFEDWNINALPNVKANMEYQVFLDNEEKHTLIVDKFKQILPIDKLQEVA